MQLVGVTKVYSKGSVQTHALLGLDLAIHKGEFVALWGPSGSGKTTALNLIGALDSPTDGVVKLEGEDLSKLSRRALSIMRRQRIGFVFQAYNLIPVLTAFENAEAVMALQGASKADRKERVMKLLADVGF